MLLDLEIHSIFFCTDLHAHFVHGGRGFVQALLHRDNVYGESLGLVVLIENIFAVFAKGNLVHLTKIGNVVLWVVMARDLGNTSWSSVG